MDESALRIEEHLYAGHWPIWCVVDGDRVLMCRETEKEARKEMEAMRGAK